MTSQDIVNKYISFFVSRGHKQIPNSSLVPENDPTTLFTSSGMQPLVPYLLGELHPQGKRLVNVQNSFRAQDIDEIGDNRHTTFFRMLGNWSLGDYFKKEQLPWIWEFLTEELKLPKDKLHVSVFEGDPMIPIDKESLEIWHSLGIDKAHLQFNGVEKNWWSRSGKPENMPIGEIGGPDTEIFYEFTQIQHTPKFGKNCHPNCNCGRFMEIANSVFIQYRKIGDEDFELIPQNNVDFGGGLERLLAAVENQPDVFQTSLFKPVINTIEEITETEYTDMRYFVMRIIVDHFVSATMILANNILPSNKEQGYVLRRLIRRALDNKYNLNEDQISRIVKSIVEQYKETDPSLVDNYEKVKNTILQESQKYTHAQNEAKSFIKKRYKLGDELMGVTEISADDAFILYTTHGLSPTQIKSLGFTFDDQAFAEKMKEHQQVSRKGAAQKFAGGLADHSEQTIKGHTATHLLHQALRDVLGDTVFQAGSNITPERVRFDFTFPRQPTKEELQKVEAIINEKIKGNLPVHFEMMTVSEAKKLGAIGLFDEKYQEKVKVYFVGDYSKEFCGGPHVDFTGKLKKFTITKEESLGRQTRRIYGVVG